MSSPDSIKRKRSSLHNSSTTDLLTVPGQATATATNNNNNAEDGVEKVARPLKKKRKEGDDEQSDSGSDSGDSASIVEKKAADKEGLPPPGKGGSLAPAGYSMNPPPTDRPVRVYADGVFDLFHLGHMRQLEQAKCAFPSTYLLVGIPNDIETHKRKGLTVLNDKERAETLRHCKWVDEVIEDAPWIVTPAFLEEHQIDYVAHDDEPYASADTDDIYKPCKEAGKFMVTQRTEGISTTYIITKIVRDYEKYITRQLKRGTSRQELNISWLKKNEIDIKRHVNELRDSIKTNWTTTGKELRDELGKFWAPTPLPRSPAPGYLESGGSASAAQIPTNPNQLHLDISRAQSPHSDFATGYSLGLIGGVRNWMQTRAVSARNSVAPSPTESDSGHEDESHERKSHEENHDSHTLPIA